MTAKPVRNSPQKTKRHSDDDAVARFVDDVVARLEAGLRSGPNTARTPWGLTIEDAIKEIRDLRALVDRAAHSFMFIRLRATSGVGDRTFDKAMQDLAWIDDEARLLMEQCRQGLVQSPLSAGERG